MILRLELGWLRLVPCWFIFAFNRNWRFRPVSTLLPLILEDSILVLSGKRTSRSDPGHVSVAHWGSHAHAEHSIKSKIYQLGWFSLIGIICNTHQRAIWWIVVIVQPKPKPVSSWPKTKISEQLSWVGQHWTSFCGNCFNLNLWIPQKDNQHFLGIFSLLRSMSDYDTQSCFTIFRFKIFQARLWAWRWTQNRPIAIVHKIVRISQGWTPFTRDWAQQVASTFRAAVESFAGSSLFNVLVGALSHHRAEFSAISEWNDELWNSLNSLNSLCVCRFFGQKEYNWLDPVWYQGMLKEVMRGRLRAQLCPDCWIHRLWTMKPLPKPWSMWGAIGAIGGAVGDQQRWSRIDWASRNAMA